MSLPHILVTGEAGHGKDTVYERLAEKFGYGHTGFANGLKDEISDRYFASPDTVTRDYLNRRETKETPLPGLALTYCSDPNFVKVALKAFEEEDRALYQQMRTQIGPLMLARSPWKEAFAGGEFPLAERLLLPRSPRRIAQVYGTEYRRLEPNGYPTYWLDVFRSKIEAAEGPQAVPDGRFPNEVDLARELDMPRIHVVRPGYGGLVGGQANSHASEQQIPPPDADTIVLKNDRDLNWLWAKVDKVVELLLSGMPTREIKGFMEDWTPDQEQRARPRLNR